MNELFRKSRDFAHKLRASFSKSSDADNLHALVKNKKDWPYVQYLLREKPDIFSASRLGIALTFLCESGAFDCVKQIRAHSEAKNISASIIRGCLVTCAANQTIETAKEILLFPQVNTFSKDDFKDALFYSLAKGDSRKRRLEHRNFEDRDGCPLILKMIEETMERLQKTNTSYRTTSSHSIKL